MAHVGRLVVLGLALAACNSDVDPQWQLDHDRIIAVRATPPGIVTGEQAKLDLLAGFAGGQVAERAPDLAQVVSPMSLADLVHLDSTGWVVDAPSDDRLAAARTELGLAATDPVPLHVGVAAAWPDPVMSPMGNGFAATKTVWLGASAVNPTLTLTINGVDPGDDELVVPTGDVHVPLLVDADDSVDIVNWLTSCGTMHDFDLHSAYLTVGKDDPQQGQLAVVVRKVDGGIAWRVWSIHAE